MLKNGVESDGIGRLRYYAAAAGCEWCDDYGWASGYGAQGVRGREVDLRVLEAWEGEGRLCTFTVKAGMRLANPDILEMPNWGLTFSSFFKFI